METNIKGYWNKKKVKLRIRYPYLTEEDLFFLEGKENEMMEILGFKLGITQQELLKIIVAI
jgi:hypothetical protein